MKAAWLSECMKEGHEWRGRAAVAGAYGRCWAQKRQFFSKMEIRKYGDLALFTKSVEQALAIGEAITLSQDISRWNIHVKHAGRPTVVWSEFLKRPTSTCFFSCTG